MVSAPAGPAGVAAAARARPMAARAALGMARPGNLVEDMLLVPVGVDRCSGTVRMLDHAAARVIGRTTGPHRDPRPAPVPGYGERAATSVATEYDKCLGLVSGGRARAYDRPCVSSSPAGRRGRGAHPG